MLTTSSPIRLTLPSIRGISSRIALRFVGVFSLLSIVYFFSQDQQGVNTPPQPSSILGDITRYKEPPAANEIPKIIPKELENNKEELQERAIPQIPVVPPPTTPTPPRFNAIAVALKTGKETALSRVPAQMLTFLKDVKNIVILAEGTRHPHL